MPKWLKTFLAILLLPLCLGIGQAVLDVIKSTGKAETFWVAMAAGAGCWLSIYLMLPKPMWAYVFGHELTHVLWTWLFGGAVKRFKATAKGGHVMVTKSNFIIALAPYFFPLYAVAVVLFFSLGHMIWSWTRYLVWFHLFLGAAYAFHLTLTWHVLKTQQSDITAHGYLFSAVIIWIGNMTVLLVGIPMLSGQVTVLTAFSWCWLETVRIFQRLSEFF